MKLSDAQEQYKSGSGEYFSLKDDKDKAAVRFLYDLESMPIDEVDTNDLDCYVIHDIEINNKRRVRACTMDSECPDCKAGNKAKLKIFIQLVDERDGKVKVWERPSKYASILLGLITRYGPLCNRLYEIERVGVKGDTQTTYQIFCLDKDDKKLVDLPDKIKLVGSSIILAPGTDSANNDKEKDKPQPQVTSRRREAVNTEDFF